MPQRGFGLAGADTHAQRMNGRRLAFPPSGCKVEKLPDAPINSPARFLHRDEDLAVTRPVDDGQVDALAHGVEPALLRQVVEVGLVGASRPPRERIHDIDASGAHGADGGLADFGGGRRPVVVVAAQDYAAATRGDVGGALEAAQQHPGLAPCRSPNA